MFGTVNTHKQSFTKLTQWISVIGHPFVLMPLLTGIVAYHLLPAREAAIVEAVALGVVIIPTGLYTLIQVCRGSWNDLDVSDQRQRNQFYAILLPLLLLLAIISWMSDLPRAIPLGAMGIMTLVAAAFVLNTWVKVSLHTGFAIFAAETLFLFRPGWAVGVFCLALMVGWSRVALGRHTVAEVVFGGLLGSVVGATFVFSMLFLS